MAVMDRDPIECAPRWTSAIAVLSLILATALQIWIATQSLATQAEVEPHRITSAGHVDAAYNGKLLAQSRARSYSASFDPNVNAANATTMPPTGAGRMAALIHGYNARSPQVIEGRTALIFVTGCVPCLVALAAFVARIPLVSVAIVPWLTAATWWLQPNQQLLASGCIELTLLGPLVTAYLASLYGFHRDPGLMSWLGLVGTALAGWAVLPMAWSFVAIVGAICWLLIAHRHDPVWNGLAILSFVLGIAPAAPPLVDTLSQPDILAHLTPNGMSDWLSPSIRSVAPPDMVAICIVGVCVLLGLIIRLLRRDDHRSSCGELLLGCATAGVGVSVVLYHNGFVPSATMDLMALLGVYLLIPVVSTWLAPRHALTALFLHVLFCGGLVSAVIDQPRSLVWGVGQLQVGWSASDAAWRDALRSTLKPTARVLWERQQHDRFAPTMLPLDFSIPVLTGRDSGGDDEPWAFGGGVLGGRAIADWSDDDLANFCDRWNIGWIRAVSLATNERLRRWNRAKRWDSTTDAGGVLYSIERRHSFVAKGRGKLESASPNEIVLTDVVPDRGELVLSYCWHPGWSASPSRVVVEPESNMFDSVPMIRLRIDNCISRLVLRWSGR